MGCQKEIAKKIRAKKGDYILQVKGNQKNLKEQVEKLFASQVPKNEHIQYDMGHGRAEQRVCKVIDNLLFFDDKEEWRDLKTIVKLESEVYQKKTKKDTKSVRYYISSSEANSKQISQDIRAHWSIENNLHWNLDVIFKEDFQLKRKGNSAENYNMIAKLALGLLDADASPKRSKNKKRLKASIDDNYREKLLNL
jgi:predicted transposase YbfD/YdcC